MQKLITKNLYKMLSASKQIWSSHLIYLPIICFSIWIKYFYVSKTNIRYRWNYLEITNTEIVFMIDMRYNMKCGIFHSTYLVYMFMSKTTLLKFVEIVFCSQVKLHKLSFRGFSHLWFFMLYNLLFIYVVYWIPSQVIPR